MDREQERTNVEEQAQETRSPSVVEENFKSVDSADEMSFFIQLIRALRETLEMSRKIPFSNNRSVDVERCLAILGDMEETLPAAIQYGVQMFNERDRIMDYAEKTAVQRLASAEINAKKTLDSAKADAEQICAEAENAADMIVREAQERADKLVAEDEIVFRAREEARIIKSEAKMDVDEMKRKVSYEAMQMLTHVEDEVAEALNAIRRTRKQYDDTAQ